MTEQPYLGSALLTPHGEGPYKSGSKHCLPHHTLASRPRLERMPSSGTQIIMKKKKTRVRPITLAAWNVRTMQDREGTACPERRSALIDRELSRYGVDIAALSETRLADTGEVAESTYTFFWSGKPETEKRESGVGFAIRSTLVSKLIEQPKAINDRLMVVKLSLPQQRCATLISIYAPTMQHTDETKEKFYSELRGVIDSVPRQDKLIILGDFNARVGADWTAWEGVLGRHGVGKCNSNGQLLLELCMTYNLSITNTMFQLPHRNRTSWMHPRSKHWHLIDYVLVRRGDIGDVRVTKSMCGADCWTDHRLVVSKLKLVLQQPRRPQGPKAPKKLDPTKLSNPAIKECLQTNLKGALESQVIDPGSVSGSWHDFKNAVYSASKETLGSPSRVHQDWFDDQDADIKALLDKKHQLHRSHQGDLKSDPKRDAFRSAKQDCQRELRRMQNKWFSDKAEEIERHAAEKNSKQLYASLNAVYGRQTAAGSPPLLDATGEHLITDKGAILERWAEHFENVLNRPSSINEEAINRLPQVDFNMSLAAVPTLDEINKAISSLSNGKAPGSDGIPAEVFSSGGPALTSKLLELFQLMWKNEELPQEYKDAAITHLYKNKGNRRVCDNHRGISLLEIAGKILARICLNRLQTHLECASEDTPADKQPSHLPETQCGFRQGRGTTDMIFTVRQLQEKSREQNKGLYITFVDLTKAFDTVSRDGLWKIMAKFGCPEKFVNIVRLFHDGMQARVKDNGQYSEPFPVTNGVKQGCVLAPTLFSMVFSAMLTDAFSGEDVGIELRSRTDGGFYKPQRLKAETKIMLDILRDLLFADDCALCASSESEMQRMVDLFSRACKNFGLTISIPKTEVMFQPAPGEPHSEPHISIDGQKLANTDKFPYLGSTMSNTATIDDEVSLRLARASASFGRLSSRVWKRRGLSNETKLKVYHAVVLPSLLYGSETWTVYARHLQRLESFHMRCLRQILHVKWQDKVPNTEVLQKAGLMSIRSMLMESQLRWSGHVARMPNYRLPKRVFFGELNTGRRSRGRPRLRYKDSLKVALKRCNIDTDSWETLAQDRVAWRGLVKRGVSAYEQEFIALEVEKRKRRKERLENPPDSVPLYPCPYCNRSFRAPIAVVSHLRTHPLNI